MTKKKFLSELEKKLSVLNESEIKDIINEYSDIIDEKVKHGKSEKEAIADFGEINDLAKEILSAYKINPDYKEGHKDEFEASAKKLGEDFDEFVKKGAAKASQVTKTVIENVKESEQEFTVEFVFELLFKAIAALLLCLVASIPVNIIKELGVSLLNMFMFPLSSVLVLCWELILGILFLVFCGFIFVAMFKPYVQPQKKGKKKAVKKMKDNERTEEEATTKVEATEDKKERVIRKSSTDSLSVVVITFMKVAVILFVLLPIWMMEFGIGIGFAVLVFGLFKGIYFWGPILLCLGGLSLLGGISSIIYRVIFTDKKPQFYSIIASLVLLFIGVFFTIDLAFNFKFIDKVPSSFEQTKIVRTIDITKKTTLENHYGDYYYMDKISKKVDNNMTDGKLQIEITYYKDVYDTPNIDLTEENGEGYIHIRRNYKDTSIGSTHSRLVYDTVVEDLKNYQMHNFDRIENCSIVITGNQATLDFVKISNYHISDDDIEA